MGLRIGYIATDVVVPHFRGASTHVMEVAKHLCAQGNQVHVVSRRVAMEQKSIEQMDGFFVHRVYRGLFAPIALSSYRNPGFETASLNPAVGRLYSTYLSSIFAIYAGLFCAQIIRRFSLDVVLERETSFGAGAVASILTGRPLIEEVIGPRVSKLSLRRAARAVVYEPRLVRGLIEEARIVVVPAAVNENLFRPDESLGKVVRKKLQLGSDPVVEYVGTFARWHGLEELVEAADLILARLPNCKFLMVGPYFQRIRRLTISRKMEKAFIFTGPVQYSDVPMYVNAGDVLVAPYNPSYLGFGRAYSIGWSLKVLEYMACGKPVVASNIGPIPRVVREGVTGKLVNPGDVKGWADAVLALLENPAGTSEMARRGREQVITRYTWKSLTQKFVRLMNETIGAPSSSN